MSITDGSFSWSEFTMYFVVWKPLEPFFRQHCATLKLFSPRFPVASLREARSWCQGRAYTCQPKCSYYWKLKLSMKLVVAALHWLSEILAPCVAYAPSVEASVRGINSICDLWLLQLWCNVKSQDLVVSALIQSTQVTNEHRHQLHLWSGCWLSQVKIICSQNIFFKNIYIQNIYI